MKLSRKEFLAGTFGVVVAGVVSAGCDPDLGGDGEDAGSGGGDAGSGDAGTTDAGGAQTSCTENGTTTQISANHGHTLTVSREDVVAGVEKSYNIQGSASHPHSVTLSAADFGQLTNNQSITVESSFDGHSHSVSVQCA